MEAGQDDYIIYVRTRNRGGVGAANVVATVYWAPVATLVTPNLWTLIDSVGDLERPDRESADGLGRDRLACRVDPGQRALLLRRPCRHWGGSGARTGGLLGLGQLHHLH